MTSGKAPSDSRIVLRRVPAGPVRAVRTTPTVTIVVPTFREVESLPHLIARVAKVREERIERRMAMRDRKEGAKDGREARKHVMRMHGGRGFGGRMIVMADTNKDGRITLAEAEALALRHFD